MKIFKILICLLFVLVISSCHDKDKTIYEYPDDDPTTEKGNIGDPCVKNEDCKSALVCLDKVCSKPVTDEDPTDDTDTEPDENEPTDDADTTPADDSDSDTGDHDPNPTDDTDTGITDEDEPEDADTQPDEDEEPYVPSCGNGIKDEGEECDNGLGNSNEPGITGITCRENCILAKCGDNILDNGELCDDGNNVDGDYCRSDCQGITGYCGDGILQTNEVCDKRNNPYCAEDCQSTTGSCGDGIKQDFEVCDTADPSVGNHEGIGAYCTNCTEKSGRCGDEIIQHGIEDCDDGDLLNGTYGHCGQKCKGSSPHCGDGILQRSNCNGYGSNCVVFAGANEVCDDGNYEDGDYCSSDCQTSFGSCGDGTIQEFETCDKAKPGVGAGQGIGAYCSDDCSEEYGRCGDAVLQTGIEECDYGDNGENGPVPNGNLNCTYGSFAPCERCTLSCKKVNGNIVFCGDGKPQPGEFCDKGDDNGKTDCEYGQTSCKVCSLECRESNGNTSFCGDGKIDGSNGEVCDPAKTDDPNSPYCSADCKNIVGRCGDGIKNGNEECDNGETGTNPNGNTKCAYGETSCEVCTVDCKKAAGTETSYCGNGGVDASNGETCDDSQKNGKYSPTATTVSDAYCNSDCKGRGQGGFCGDGNMQRANCNGFDDCTVTEGANEACDEGTNNGKTACAYGETSCTVCTTSCSQTAGTEISYCGDGKIDSSNNEVCDKADPSVGDHQGIGAYCSDDCRTKTGFCGDGTKQENEVCDKAEPNIGNHQGIGAYCSDDCQTKFGECGDGIRNQDNNGNWLETCDDGTANNGHYKHDAPGYCNENCKGYGEGGYCGDSTKQTEEECEHSGNIQIYCPYGQEECQVCSSDCTLKAGKTAKCNDGILQRADCTGYEDKGCVVTAGANEVCDDGDDNGKYGGFCNATCSGITPHCNDGILQRADCTGYGEDCVVFNGANEECDDGEHNGQYRHDAPGYCNTGCNGRGNGGYCGDRIKNGSEKCDDPDGLNGTYGHCNGDCSGDSPKCGDGIIHREDCTGYDNCVELDGVNEECDDGTQNGSYGRCNSSCTAKLICNDGIIQREDCTGYANCVVLEGANEECDDGTENGGYEKCNATCSGYNEGGYCGDGKVQRENCDGYTLCDENTTENCCVVTAGANEMCDGGDNNGHYSAEAPGHCNANCDGFAEGGTCGDRKVQKATSEACETWVAEDPGNRRLCDENTTEDCCAVAEGADENCDEGTENGQYGHCNPTCSSVSLCNDGIIKRPDCTGYANCIEMEGADESCDDGFANGTYGSNCNKTCDGYTGYCNDGIIQRANCEGYDNCVVTLDANEECDDNIFYNGKYGHCNSTCSGLRPERCGDGKVQKDRIEDCAGMDLCDEYITENCCEVVPEADENCDEGDGVNGTFGHCDNNCKVVVTYRCGDGKVQKDRIEDCAGMDLCDEYITENCCEVVLFAEGDSPEACDEGALNNNPEHCNSTCSGMTPYCGDGIIQRADCTGYDNCRVVAGMNEECDEAGSNGYYGHCNATCSGPGTERCGDGILQRSNCNGFNNCVVVPGAYENCDEEDSINGHYYGHCDATCSQPKGNTYCGDGKIQKASTQECADWVAEDSGNRHLCDENTTENCCEVVQFLQGDNPETCDEGDNNGYHDHCNTTCDGTSYCGDGFIGKDEICEPGEMEEPLPCAMMPQFQPNSKMIHECDSECMPILECDNAASFKIPFFDTKQTLCYDNSDSITCPASASDDFYGQSPQFEYKEQDYEVTAYVINEKVSKLTWQRATPSSYDSCALGSSCTYAEAHNYCLNLELGGYSDWRLPKALELPTIADFAASNHLYSGFENTNGSYWTEESAAFSTSDGTLITGYSGTAQIKCVRTSEKNGCPTCNIDPYIIQFGQKIFVSAYNDNSFAFWYFNDLENGLSWQDALAFCQGVGKGGDNNNGINNMRLPTVNELISLISTENGQALIPGLNKKTWTSTTFNNDPTQAYVVDFSTGSVTYEPKTNSNIVICVE
ncbi:DUF1566 domain-containing protein [bacterium]|nr:DUF1566 domain-containing protein [bacterium]